MSNPVKAAAKAWEAEAIEKCRTDPKLSKQIKEAGLCYVCMCPHPCICTGDNITYKLETYYKHNQGKSLSKIMNDMLKIVEIGILKSKETDKLSEETIAIIIREMEAYYKRNPTGDHERAAGRNWGEGKPITELMRGLMHIAEDGIFAARKEKDGLKQSWNHAMGTGFVPANPKPLPASEEVILPHKKPESENQVEIHIETDDSWILPLVLGLTIAITILIGAVMLG